MLLADAIEDYLAAKGARSPHTLAAYRRALVQVGQLLAADAGVGLDELALDAVDGQAMRRAWAQHRRGGRAGRRAPASMALAHAAWSGLWRWLVDTGAAVGNPMAGIDRDVAPPPVPKAIPGGDDALRRLFAAAAAGEERRRADGGADRRYLAAWPERDVALLAVLEGTGLRLGALCGLRLSSRRGGRGERVLAFVAKGGAEATVPLPAAVDRALDDYLADRAVRFAHHDLSPTSGAPLWVHRRSGDALSRDQIQHLVGRLYRRAGVPKPAGANVHAHRHTFATGLARQGASAREIQRLLGHASIATSQRYIDATGRELAAAAESAPVTAVLAELRH